MRRYVSALAIGLMLAATPIARVDALTAGAAARGSVQEPAEQVDINTATAEELETVPGIGPATAARIIEWRETQGRFERLEDLLNIRGIGTRTLERLRPYLKVGEPPSDGASG